MATPNLPDLNAIRDRMLESQRNGDSFPSDPKKQVRVTRDGDIVLGSEAGVISAPLARVEQDTFAETRLDRDKEVARVHLPANTKFFDQPCGWRYEITSALGERYTLFAYFTGSDYQVKLLDPPLEGKYNVHDAHLYSDGSLCLSDKSGYGQPSLEQAFSKSVLWATGIGYVKQGRVFPFSKNNLG